ncbi:MAG: T9SS type A sorting domain-containing protein [Candidatus Kapabacteria bacterium]|nr:T9SS type A sorting domain-containing protein [Candidatus Kapabacteria bacterium]
MSFLRIIGQYYKLIILGFSILLLSEECSESNITISFAPNPASDYTEMTISLVMDAIVNIGIYNSMGEMVKEVNRAAECKSGENKFQVDVHDLKNGVYLVRVVLDNLQKTEKLIIIR